MAQLLRLLSAHHHPPVCYSGHTVSHNLKCERTFAVRHKKQPMTGWLICINKCEYKKTAVYIQWSESLARRSTTCLDLLLSRGEAPSFIRVPAGCWLSPPKHEERISRKVILYRCVCLFFIAVLITKKTHTHKKTLHVLFNVRSVWLETRHFSFRPPQTGNVS